MTLLKSNNSGSYCTYPGEYVPAPFSMDEVSTALQQPCEGNAVPLVNVVDTANTFTVEVAAPGLKSSDFLVSVHQDVLSVSVLHEDPYNSQKTYRQREFNYSCFKKDISLPDSIDTDFLSAEYKQGILYVLLPKSKKNFVNEVGRVIIY